MNDPWPACANRPASQRWRLHSEIAFGPGAVFRPAPTRPVPFSGWRSARPRRSGCVRETARSGRCRTRSPTGGGITQRVDGAALIAQILVRHYELLRDGGDGEPRAGGVAAVE